jgi:hypothetical protein
MSEPPVVAPPLPPQEAPRKASRARIITMMILGGIVLAVGGCALFLGTMNFNSGSVGALGTLGAIGFIGGVLSFIGGIIWALIRFVNRRFDKSGTKAG